MEIMTIIHSITLTIPIKTLIQDIIILQIIILRSAFHRIPCRIKMVNHIILEISIFIQKGQHSRASLLENQDITSLKISKDDLFFAVR